ncbi:hypothetical protein ACE6H2_008048 [Prunus campanulata]
MSKDPERKFLHFTQKSPSRKRSRLGTWGRESPLGGNKLKTIYFSDCNFPKLPKNRKEENKEKRGCVEKINGAVNFEGHKLFPRASATFCQLCSQMGNEDLAC